MSEYTEVEQPFLHQLQGLGWRIIDQGPEIPSDPTKSQRLNFRQWPQSDSMAEGMNQQQQPVNGILNKANLLGMLRTSSVFMDTGGGPRVKVVTATNSSAPPIKSSNGYATGRSPGRKAAWSGARRAPVKA